MTDSYSAAPPAQPNTSPADGKADVARDEAAQLRDETLEAGSQVADVAKDEAANVVDEAKTQAKDLFAQTQQELKDQAASQQRRVADGLHSISDELSDMARSSSGGGVASDLVEQAATRTGDIASWLGDRDPGLLLGEVRRFAGRRPGTFIAIAVTAGVLAGRLTRSAAGAASEETGATPDSSGSSAGSRSSQSTGASGASTPAASDVSTPTATPVYSSLAGDAERGTAAQAFDDTGLDETAMNDAGDDR